MCVVGELKAALEEVDVADAVVVAQATFGVLRPLQCAKALAAVHPHQLDMLSLLKRLGEGLLGGLSEGLQRQQRCAYDSAGLGT